MQIYTAPVVVPVDVDPIKDGAVVVDGDGLISFVGPQSEIPQELKQAANDAGTATVEFDGVLTPGLVNAHTHLCYSSYTDFYESDKEFFEWIQGFAKRNPAMTEEEWAASIQSGIDQLLRHGVTAVADIVTPASGFSTLLKSPLTGTLYWEAVFHDAASWEKSRSAWREVLTETRATNNNPNLTIGVSPHTLYTLDNEVAASLAEFARTFDVRLHPHLAETSHEDMYVRRGAGPFAFMCRRAGLTMRLVEERGAGHSPAKQAEKLKWLGKDSHVAHGVHLDADDRKLLRDTDTVTAMCIRSNARLGSGTPPVAAFRAEGNTVAVGTDSLASSPSLDVLGELSPLRVAALEQGDNGEGLDRWLFEAVTMGGAKALGRKDIGSLSVGKRADMAHFSIPVDSDPYATLVARGAGQCTATIIKGERQER